MWRTALVLVGSLAVVRPVWAGTPAGDLYLNEVKPILVKRCFACHGGLKQESDLRLDAISEIRRGGASGPAVLPGRSADSPLLKRVTETDKDLRMPLEGEPLSAEQIAVLKTWIDRGALAADEPVPPDPSKHWSFLPPQRPPVPNLAAGQQPANPIDAFLLAKQRERGLRPLHAAEKGVLLRRVYLDLIGLPPTPQELHKFLAEASPQAYEAVVDRLMASPAYGERWARHWMDIWRYADAFGLDAEVRYSWRHMWRWRDWIIQSLNTDKGYDRMILEMLAADEIAPDDPAVLAANGFLARSWYLFNRNVWLDNIVEHTSKGLLGLTMNCARCHDHKYDPIGQEDYYQLRAFFEPHMLRSDRVPGEIDVTKNGLARIYDAELKAPTYLFVRGDELQPNKELPIKPAVPKLFGADTLIAEVKLPVHAYYPALRPFEQQETLAAAEKRCHATLAALQQANDALASNERRWSAVTVNLSATLPPAPHETVLADDFKKPRPELWKSMGGEWEHVGDGLVQKQVDAPQCRLVSLQDHPRDFTSTMNFSIVAGGTRAVGVAFDADEHGYVGVFMSPTGSKVQVYYVVDGKEIYPSDAIHEVAVNNGRRYDLKVAVRDRLVNVWVDGKLLLAHTLLNPRRPGRFAVTSFGAVVKFVGIAVAVLPSQATLLENLKPSAAEDAQADAKAALEQSNLMVDAAAKNESAARAQRVSLHARQSAESAKYSPSPPTNMSELVLAAGRAEQSASAAEAGARVANVRLKLAETRAAVKNDGAMKGKGKAAADAVAAAEKELAELQMQWTALAAKPRDEKPPYSPLGPVYPQTSSGRRLALARWIADRKNPLTARVAVNHMWVRHFGEPFVASMFDFGLRTPRPSQAELLDWLAVEFMDSGWSMKKLHRLMVTSQAYRRQSTPAREDPNQAVDPDNHFLWRMNVRRMEGEIVRDSLLVLSGKLDATLGGPDLPVPAAGTGMRRTLYYRYAREPHDKVSAIAVFDGPNVEDCYRRQETIVPQQALLMMNSDMTLKAASDITAAIHREIGGDVPPYESAAFISAAFTRILGRAPSAEERAECETALSRLAELAVVGAADGGAPHVRAREGLIHVLLNHNDFVSIR